MLSNLPGQYDRAKKLYKRILKTTQPPPPSSTTSMKNNQGVPDDDTLCINTAYNLATLLYKQYRSGGNEEVVGKEAQELFERALRGQSKSSALGPHHPTTLTTTQDLAELLQHRHHYEAAQEMWERLLQGQELSLGKLDVATLSTLHRMATMFNEQACIHINTQLLYHTITSYYHTFT